MQAIPRSNLFYITWKVSEIYNEMVAGSFFSATTYTMLNAAPNWTIYDIHKPYEEASFQPTN